MNNIEKRIEKGKEIKPIDKVSLVEIFKKEFPESTDETSKKIEPSVETVESAVKKREEEYLNFLNKKQEEYLNSVSEKIKPYEDFSSGDIWGERKGPHFHLRSWDSLTRKRFMKINEEAYKNVVGKYLDNITHEVSGLKKGLNEIGNFSKNMINPYFPMIREVTGKITETEDKRKDVILENEKKLKILFGLYEKFSKAPKKETLEESEIYKKIAELERQVGFTGGDAIPPAVLKKYAEAIKKGYIGCIKAWANLIKQCPSLGPQPENLTLFKTLAGVLSVIQTSLEELTKLEDVNKQDVKPVQLGFTIAYNIETTNEIISQILNLGVEKVTKALSEIKIGEEIEDIVKALKRFGYKDIKYYEFDNSFGGVREPTPEEIKEIEAIIKEEELKRKKKE